MSLVSQNNGKWEGYLELLKKKKEEERNQEKCEKERFLVVFLAANKQYARKLWKPLTY